MVKTKGRMVEGEYVPGQGLADVTVTLQGRSAVLSHGDGTFSFPMQGNTFMVLSVQKKGYQLVDADMLNKLFKFSDNTFYLVMETPEQQQADQVAAERKLRRTLQLQLHEREDEIDAMAVSLEEKNRLLAELYRNQENNEKLITEMARQYAAMDYDLMDALNRQISDAILNGELQRADSLLRSKGDINERNAEINRRLGAEALRKEELAREQEELSQSESGTKKLIEDFAADCLKYHEMYKLQNKYDSALYYIELRASRDTTNAYWQSDAADYCHSQNQFRQAVVYYERALTIRRSLAHDDPQSFELDLAGSLNNLALLYYKTTQFGDAERLYKEAVEICRKNATTHPQVNEAMAAEVLNNLAILYSSTQRLDDAEKYYQEALAIRRHLAIDNPKDFEPEVAISLNGLGNLYSNTQRFNEAESCFKESLEIRKVFAKNNPKVFEPVLAETMNNLAYLYDRIQRIDDAEAFYKEALDIYTRLSKDNPQAYEPVTALIQVNLAIIYSRTRRYDDAEQLYLDALAIRRRLAQDNPDAYDKDVALTLFNLGASYYVSRRFGDAELMYLESLGIRRRLAKDHPAAFDPDVAITLKNLASLYLETGRFEEAEAQYNEALAIRKRLARDNPMAYEPYVARSINDLANLYFDTHRYNDADRLYQEALEIYQKLAENNPQAYSLFVANTLGGMAFNAICMLQYARAEQLAREGLSVAPTKVFNYSNLAAALLFQGKYSEAEGIYRQYKDELKVFFVDDLNLYAEAGVIPKEFEADVARIKELLNN